MENLDEEFILLDQLMEPASVEKELELEKRIRWFSQVASKEQLTKHCEVLERQHFHKDQFIANCLTEIAKCKAKISCMENRVKQPPQKHWSQKMFGL
jgi:hypothetical protein